jgi:hypothetical protein
MVAKTRLTPQLPHGNDVVAAAARGGGERRFDDAVGTGGHNDHASRLPRASALAHTGTGIGIGISTDDDEILISPGVWLDIDSSASARR